MSQDWMIDVLVDLRGFAQKNGLEKLADQLDDTIHIAAAELIAHARMKGAHDQNDSPARVSNRTRGVC
jgi:hypothetical protein